MKDRLIAWLFNRLFQRFVMGREKVDYVIGQPSDPYLYRWFVFGRVPDPTSENPNKIRSRTFLGHRAYLHCFLRSDDDRALHDHPSYSLSISLKGSAFEHTINAGGVHSRRRVSAGNIRFRSAKFAHRIEINDGEYWTLFIFGPNLREWGFHCPDGWKHWKKFTAKGNSGAIGQGCGE